MIKRVFCAGVWDLCHEGHRALLKKAATFGELTVGVVIDTAVKKHKGKNRPIMCDKERFYSVDDLKYVTKTIYLTRFLIPTNIITSHDIIIMGEDQSHFENTELIPYEKKIIFPRYKGISTSDIVKKIKDL